MAALAIVAGLLIGLSLGALGGGGSILAVPALVYLLGQSPHQATTASLLVVGAAAVVGAITHARAGRVRLREGAVFGALGIAGSYAGSHLSAAVPANLLLTGFGVLMLAVAAAMLARQSRPGPATAAWPWTGRSSEPSPPPRWPGRWRAGAWPGGPARSGSARPSQRSSSSSPATPWPAA